MIRRRWAIGLLVVVAAGSILGCLCQVARISYVTEIDYLMSKNVLDLVEGYVIENGDWPRSWDDLRRSGRLDRHVPPADLPGVRERIFIDFDARLATLARQRSDEFRAIRPRRPSEFHPEGNLPRGSVESLLAAIRRIDRPGGDR